MVTRNLTKWIPAPPKRWVKNKLRTYKLSRAIGAIHNLELGQVPSRETLSELIRGWGNEGYAARLDYVEEVAKRAVSTRGPVLECGSGITSILLGLLAGRRGIETWSLEHSLEWREQVESELRRSGINHVNICHSALHEYEGFSWYDPPLERMPKEFLLVVCDGPPGDDKDGRYGLLPILGERIPQGASILLDDANRPGELEVLDRWTREANLSVEVREGSEGIYAIVERR